MDASLSGEITSSRFETRSLSGEDHFSSFEFTGIGVIRGN